MQPRTVLITGASSGIGRALALEYGRGGAHVAVAARREDELQSVATEIRALGGRALVLPLDVSDTAAAKAAVERAEREMGSLDMVVANAGRGDNRHSATLTWEEVASVIQLNLAGACATLLAAVPIMVAQRAGQLVAVTSLAGRRGLPRCAAYSGTKAGLSAFVESLRLDLALSGIHVTDVQPGFVATPMSDAVRGVAKTPFKWPVDRAARYIKKRLESAPPMIAFPWQLALLTRISRGLPAWIYDPIVRGKVDPG